MPTIEDNLSKVKEDHLERLLDAYETRSKEFHRLFSSLVIFALIFLFIILLPYIALQIKNHEVSDALKVLQNQMEPIANRLEAYQQAQNGIQDLSQRLNNSPEELHKYINDLDSKCNSSSGSENQSSQITQTSNQNCPNDKAQKDVWFNQKIQDHIQQQFVDFDEVMNQEVIAPLHSIDEVANPIDITTLTNGLSKLHSAFKTKLDENPSFWKKFEDKVSFYTQLDQELGGVWSNYDSEIKSQGEKLETELTNIETEIESQENQQHQLMSEETKISDRLNQIEFPFGKFPIGLRESILIFPLMLSIGFFICASLLSDTIRTRASFQHLYQQKDPGQQIINARQVSLIAPLPVDPNDTKRRQAVQFAILLIPFMIFIAACGLTLYSWRLPTVDSSVYEFKWMYGILYVLGLVFFAYAYQRILTELRQYGNAN